MLESGRELEERAAAAVELAKSVGADGAWAAATSMRSTSCEVRNGKLEKMQESNSRRLSLDLYVAGRYFQHRTSDLRDAQLKAFVQEAVALTRSIQRDPFRKLPDPALFAGRSTKNLELVDDSLAELTPEERIDRCLELDEQIAGKPKVISASSSFSDGRYVVAMASSNGFSGTEASTWMGLYGNVTLQGDGDKRPEGGMGATVRHAQDLPKIAWLGQEAMRRATSRLGSTKGPTMKAPMVVDRMAAARMLYPLLMPASGSSIQQGRSFWADKMGKRLLSPKFEVIDDPHVVRGMASRRFDGEGIASKPRTMIKDGALQGYYLDTYYASKLKMKPTGGSPSNLIVTPGEGDAESLCKNVGKGVYVTSWLGGNSDSTTGEFSLGIRGHLIERGKIGAPVGEMNVTGNGVDLFANLIAVGADPWIYSSARTPTLVFDNVSFSGS